MSMIANYIRLRPEELEALVRNPPPIVEFLHAKDEELANFPQDERQLDIDKTWHALNYLLTGDPWEGDPPLANVVLGGTELGEEDVGWGPARYLTQEQVREVAAALESMPMDELRRRYHPDDLEKADIYPSIWRDDDALDYVLFYYEDVRRFFRSAAEAGDCALLFLN